MAIHVIGTSAGVPSASAGTCGVLLEYVRGAYLLYDCPEGTSRMLLRWGIPVTRVEVIVVSHMHADHVGGLVGLLSLCEATTGGRWLPRVFGPLGLQEYFEACGRWIGGFPGVVVETPAWGVRVPLRASKDPKDLTKPEVSVLFFPLRHVVPAVGLCVFVGAERRFVLISDNCAETLLEDPKYDRETGRDFASFARRTGLEAPDVLLHELTYLRSERAKASARGHSHSGMVARLCDVLRPRLVLLNHFSPRYRRPLTTPNGGHDGCKGFVLRPVTTAFDEAFEDPIARDWFEASSGRFPTVFAVDGATVRLFGDEKDEKDEKDDEKDEKKAEKDEKKAEKAD